MTARDWFDVWTRCADRYRAQCSAELVLATNARELERASSGRARVLPHLRKAMWLAARAERAHDHALDAFTRAYPAHAELEHAQRAARRRH